MHLLALLTTLLSLGPFAAIAANSPEARQLESVREKIGQLTQQVQQEQQQRDEHVALLKQVDEKLSRQGALLLDTEQQIVQVTEREQQLHAQLGPLRKQLAGQREHLSRQVVSTWKMGRQQYLKLLMSQQNPERISRMLNYYDYLNRARVSQIEAIRSSYRELFALNRALEDERQRLQQLKDQQHEILNALEESKLGQERVVAEWNEKISGNEGRLRQLREDASTLDHLVKQIDKAIPEAFRHTGDKRFVQLKGKLNWPVKGRLLKQFGENLSGDVALEGVVIGLKEGSPVRAIHGGTIVFADWLRGYGMLAIVEHDNGYMSLYGYNQTLLKNVGDKVYAGEMISMSGRSGGQQQASLYFAIRKGADSVNPSGWCKSPARGKVG